MSMVSAKQLMGKAARLLFITVLLFLVLTWIPCFWKYEVGFDKGAFANEYYKTIVDIGKILFGFWLANIFLKRSQTKEFLQRIHQQWQEKARHFNQVITILEGAPLNADIDIEELSEQIRDDDIGLCYLSELISGQEDRDKLGLLGNVAFEYKEEVHGHVKEILSLLETGEMIGLKPFSDKVVENINSIKDFLTMQTRDKSVTR